MKWKKLVNESIEMKQLMEDLRNWLIEETESGNISGYVKDYDNDPHFGCIFVHLRNDRIRKELEGVDSPLRFRRYLKEDIKEALDESIAKFCKRNNYSPHVFSIRGDTANLDDWDFLVIDIDMWWISHELD